MKPEVKQKWLEALRSGDFAQEQGRLHPPQGGFCCLGVLCELHRRETKLGSWEGVLRTTDRLRYSIEGKGSTGLPPVPVQEWAGLDDADPMVLPGGDRIGRHCLSSLNDAGATFEEIAALIEAQL